MKVQWIIGALACAAAFGAQAQYKYIGPDGRVVYSDQPPPPTAKVLKKDAVGAPQTVSGPELPYALAQATKGNPVTLYTAPNCGAPCNDGRKLLSQRGVPFTEKTISTPEDAAEFAKTINSQQVPVMMVGKNKLAPFAPDDWNGALTTAGYPASNQLPAGYKNPTPTNVVQAPVAAAPATAQAANPGTPSAVPSTPAAPADGGAKPSWFKGF